MRYVIVIMAIGLLGFILCVPCFGQSAPRYRPQRPTISPYVNLLRNDSGPVPNYYSLVRPQQDQQAWDREASRFAQSSDLAIRQLNTIVDRREIGPTGTGSVFNNYSHYYGTNPSLRRRR